MEMNEFRQFVQITAQTSGHTFTLDGEPVHPKELADPQTLLPLVVAYINSINRELSSSPQSHLELIQQADPNDFALGWSAKELPAIPPGAIFYFANHVIRKTLAEVPMKGLQNPTIDTAHHGETIELRPHLEHLGLVTAITTPERQITNY